MEKQVIIITTEAELDKSLSRFASKILEKQNTTFEDEKLTRTQAAELAGVSLPTLRKMVNDNLFPEHGYGRKKFFLKSEVIAGLKRQADEKDKNRGL